MMSPDDYNAIRGHAFAIIVMDSVRTSSLAGERVTLWSLRQRIGDRYQLGPQARRQLYGRLRNLIKQFENSGLITTALEWNAEAQVNTKVITLCPSTSSPS